MKRVVSLLALIVVAAFTVGARYIVPLQSPSTPDALPNWCVSVWYPSSDTSGGLDSIQQNADLIGVVNPFWYTPNADGTIQSADADAGNADQLAQWRADGLTIIPTISSGIWQMITDPTVRAFHVDQIATLVDHMNYDGIDIDYESFPLATRDDFSAFIEALSARLHQDGKLLTVAVHAKTDDAGTWYGAAAQDWTRIAPAVDVMSIMTYDYTDRNQPPGPIGPPGWTHDVLAYAATVTDLRKVRMGLHFYGYSWLRDSPPATATTWQAAQRLITSFHLPIERDPADMEAHVELRVRGLPPQTIYFADSTGIEYKLGQILNDFPDLGGVAIWGIGGEDPANWDVLRAARPPNCVLR